MVMKDKEPLKLGSTKKAKQKKANQKANPGGDLP